MRMMSNGWETKGDDRVKGAFSQDASEARAAADPWEEKQDVEGWKEGKRKEGKQAQ